MFTPQNEQGVGEIAQHLCLRNGHNTEANAQ